MRAIEDALEVLNALNSQGKIEYAAYSKLYDTIAMIETEPVRHGHWEMKSDPYGFFDEIPVCSECGCTTKMRETYNYCPHCGAYMGVEDEPFS